MTEMLRGEAILPSIGHAIVRSGPWRFERADSQTRQFFDLPDGEISGVPLFIPAARELRDAPPVLDFTLAGALKGTESIRAKLLAIPSHPGLYSAVFFQSGAGNSLQSDPMVRQQDLQHRISNCLAVIRSMFRRTAQTSHDTDTLISHFLGRLDAFARIQSNLALYDTYGVALDELILDEFMAHAMRTGNQLSVDGPPVRLKTRSAETFSLAIHELATNSVKFGALGSETGAIAVRWRRVIDKAGSPTLHLEWIESGVPLSIQEPIDRGFGTDMIENRMAFEFGATSSVVFRPDGMYLSTYIPINDELLHTDDVEELAS